MKSGGFPCRSAECDIRFQVRDQGSMAALLAASAERDQHEISVHNYHHEKLEQPVRAYGAFSAGASKARKRE